MDWPRGWSVFLVTRVSAVITVLMWFTGVDQEQLKCVSPPIPKFCDHHPATCNSCWTGYPQSRFPNWTKKQVEKAKIYNVIHNYSKLKPCICYRVDVNDHGLFTHTKEITTVYGEEDTLWNDLIHEHEKVSCIVIICGENSLKKETLLLETIWYTIESHIHWKCVWTGSSDAGHEVSIFYPSFFEVLIEG